MLIAGVDFYADGRTEEISEPATATELVVEPKRLVVARERPKRAKFELMSVLCVADRGNDSKTEQDRNERRAHGSLGLAALHFNNQPVILKTRWGE